MKRLTTMGALLALTAVGCGSCGGSTGGEGAETTGDQQPESSLGVVEGVVRLAPGAELPTLPPEPTEGRPPPPESCTPPRLADRQPVRMGADRGLEGTLVAASEFDAAPEHDPVAHEVVIRDCRLDPMLVVATRGDTIELKNETDYPFMPIMGSGGLAQALLHGQTRTLDLDQGGVATIACTFTASCGRTDVVTMYHPFHTVTGEGGHFSLEVPAGEEIEVHAWHPLFQEAAQTLTVAAGETKHVDFVLEPAPAQAAPEGESAEGESAEGEAAEGESAEGEAAEEDEGQASGHPEDDTDTLF